jgi:hypothetical protein
MRTSPGDRNLPVTAVGIADEDEADSHGLVRRCTTADSSGSTATILARNPTFGRARPTPLLVAWEELGHYVGPRFAFSAEGADE